MLVDLMTHQGEELLASRETPWQIYPRPQMRRNSYVNLNGAWDFHVNYENQGKIRVPFCPENRKIWGFRMTETQERVTRNTYRKTG